MEMRERAVRAVLQGQAQRQVAEAYGIDRTTLYRWVCRFQACGDGGLLRKSGSGRPRLLAEFDMEALNDIVLEPASHFGFETDLWTVGRLRCVLQDRYGITLSSNTVWRRLRDAGFTYQKPERRYFELNEEAREKWLRDEVPRIRAAVREFRAILYFPALSEKTVDGPSGRGR